MVQNFGVGLMASMVHRWFHTRNKKSISAESTFDSDTIDLTYMYTQLVKMTKKICFELRQQNKLIGCINVKIRYADFKKVSKQSIIAYSSADQILHKKVKELFAKLYDRRLLVRMLVVRFTHLVPGNNQIDIYEDSNEVLWLYLTLDSMKHRYGRYLIIRASGLF